MSETLTTHEIAPFLVYDGDALLPIAPGSLTVPTGAEFIGWTNLHDGQIEVYGVAAGTAVVHAELNGKSGDLEIVVTETPSGTLTLTLGPKSPR